MTPYENRLRAWRFAGPQWIPCEVFITEQAWLRYPADELSALQSRHPRIFPESHFRNPDINAMPTLPWRDSSRDYIDSWGVRWRTLTDGMTGSVMEHPLESWEAWDGFNLPDPEKDNGWGPVDWNRLADDIAAARSSGRMLPAAELRHGHTFLTLEYLRGFDNLAYDMFDEDYRLLELLECVEKFNMACLNNLIAADPDVIGFPEDLGAQSNSLISPAMFRKFIKPSYKRLMATAKAAGKTIHMHCDGWILNLADDLLDCGVEILNIQDVIHGIDNLKECLQGRVALDLDIDRQDVTVNGKPSDIRDLIHEEIEKLARPAGGLSLCFEVRPPVSLMNVEAVCSAMEEFC